MTALFICTLVTPFQFRSAIIQDIMLFKNKTVFITGASRGIGKAIALKLASFGANIVVAAKTVELDPRLEGTIYTAAEEMKRPAVRHFRLDWTFAMKSRSTGGCKAVDKFGGIDILINNASAINLSGTEKIEAKRFDLMQSINVRGTFLMSKACIPDLRKSSNPHMLTLSPPLNMDPRWFAPHLAYTMSKYGMSMVALGLSEELRADKIAVNALWPRTTIATAAVQNLLGGDHPDADEQNNGYHCRCAA